MKHLSLDIDYEIDATFKSYSAVQWEQNIKQLKWVDRNTVRTNANLYSRILVCTSSLLARLYDIQKRHMDQHKSKFKKAVPVEAPPRLTNLISQLELLAVQAKREYTFCVRETAANSNRLAANALQHMDSWLIEEIDK